jgi:hypothetical protein
MVVKLHSVSDTQLVEKKKTLAQDALNYYLRHERSLWYAAIRHGIRLRISNLISWG